MPEPKAECPNCGESIRFSRYPKLGQKVTCSHCGERLEVIYLEPIELDFEYEEEAEYYEYGSGDDGDFYGDDY
jgi:lysine biosynthesis protein LysW